MSSSDQIASVAAGQIAMQTLLSVLIHLFIAESEDRDSAKREIARLAEGMIDSASIPDLPALDQTATREEAKAVVRLLVLGYSSKPS